MRKFGKCLAEYKDLRKIPKLDKTMAYEMDKVGWKSM